MVFPLPLSPIEQYMLSDDRPSHPMIFYLRLRLDGMLNRSALEQAFQIAIERHPLLRAKIKGRGRQRHWIAANEAPPEMHWVEDLDHDVVQSAESIDLEKQTGLRVSVCQSEGAARLWLAFHHACCDGKGAIQFTEDLLLAYAALREGRTPDLSPLQESHLAKRTTYTRSRFTQALLWPIEMFCTLGSIEYFMHRPVPLAPLKMPSPDEDQVRPQLASYRHEFSMELSQQLSAAARREGVTLNDLLLRDLFLASQQSRQRSGQPPEAGHVRVIVPMNLRTSLHDAMPAANCVSMIHLDRRVWRWKKMHKMLRVLHWEMVAVKRFRASVSMLRIICLLQRWTDSLGILLSEGHCNATCVLSNLGRVWQNSALSAEDGGIQAGDVRVEQLELLPPVRPWTGAALGVASLNGRLTISLLADRRMLGPDGGEELLAIYTDRLRESAGS